MEDKLTQAVQAIEAGKPDSAMAILFSLVAIEPNNEDAWLWMAAASLATEQRRACLEQVLRINPLNREARRGLVGIQAAGPPEEANTVHLSADSSQVGGTKTAEITSEHDGSHEAPRTQAQDENSSKASNGQPSAFSPAASSLIFTEIATEAVARLPLVPSIQAAGPPEEVNSQIGNKTAEIASGHDGSYEAPRTQAQDESSSKASIGRPSALSPATSSVSFAEIAPKAVPRLPLVPNPIGIQAAGPPEEANTVHLSADSSEIGGTKAAEITSGHDGSHEVPRTQAQDEGYSKASIGRPSAFSPTTSSLSFAEIASEAVPRLPLVPSPMPPNVHSQHLEVISDRSSTEVMASGSANGDPLGEAWQLMPSATAENHFVGLEHGLAGELAGENIGDPALSLLTPQGLSHISQGEGAAEGRKSRFKKSARKWDQPFQTEGEIKDRFPDYLDELMELSQSLGMALDKQLESLKYARRKYEEASSLNAPALTFLAPSIQAAAAVAEALLMRDRHQDAFWVGNSFGEISKVLVTKNKGKYQETFGRLLLVSFCAAVESFAIDANQMRADNQEGEIARLRGRLDNVCRFALGTYFSIKAGKFVRDWQPDTAFAERLTSQALARHFDLQLRHLINDDRPRVREYVTANLPLIYRFKLDESWDRKIEDWETLLTSAGYDDLIHYLRSTGLLIRVDKVGQLTPERLDDVRRAAANNDLSRVRDLLKDSADELKLYLYSEAQARLDYRQPPQPHLPDRVVGDSFSRAKRLIDRGEPDGLKEALGIVQSIWERDISSLELRDWVAFLHAKNNNPKAAEPILDQLRKRRESRQNAATVWNLAVLAYDRKDEAGAYELLTPLLEEGSVDEGLTIVVLALSLKLDDVERFLSTIPKTLSLRFHPLGVVVAHDFGDRNREGEFLTQLLRQSQKWELPPVPERFSSIDVFNQAVNRGIVEGQIEQLISWLEARINANRGWIPNYLALARVYEEERQDVSSAFRVLSDRLTQLRGRQADQQRKDEACRELLDLCRRTSRRDLGQQAYALAVKADASQSLLDSYGSFAPPASQAAQEPPPITPVKTDAKAPPQPPIRDPRLAERLAWVTARLAGIRNVSTYSEEAQAIGEFVKIMLEMSPQESGTVVKLIQDISEVIEIFNRTDADDHDTRRVLYDRTTGYEVRLADLVASGALSRALADVLTPYHAALKKVAGDLSRQAGVGPNIEASLENMFLSLESERSTLVLRLTNASERSASDIRVELLLDSNVVSVVGRRERRLAALESRRSALLTFPVELRRGTSGEVREIAFGISLRASAEGFPDVDLGITRRSLPVKTVQEATGVDQIPKLFQSGNPLKPSEPDLFQGRGDIISKIGGSFYGGVQRERFFLDGIRRVGKTSILNFLPLHLQETVFPVPVNLDKFGLRGPTSSAAILQQFCILVRESAFSLGGVSLDLPASEAFEINPGQAFNAFLASLKASLPGRAPFVMVDEFQELLYAVARSGSGRDRDTLVLDQIRGHSDEGSLYMIFTGSVRFDRLSEIVDHRIFGSLTRLRVSFLSEGSVGDVLRAGLSRWGSLPSETIRRVYELTGGYPWLVQTYGAGLVDALNRERRTTATPDDVDYVTNDAVLCNDELFAHWWPTEQLGVDEERFVEWLLRHYPSGQPITTRDFFSSIHNRDLPNFRRAFENLRACEVLDSTQTETLRFSGSVLRQWLEQKVQDGQLKVRVAGKSEADRGQVGVFVDHENLVKTLERISRSRGVDIRADRLAWFSRVMSNLLAEAERRFGSLKFKITVAFWERPQEAGLLPAYFRHGFIPASPEPVKLANAVDFKVASEVRRAAEQALREGTRLGRAVIVTGDGDLSHETRALVNDGVSVQIWGGSRETSEAYREIVGAENVVMLDDISGI